MSSPRVLDLTNRGKVNFFETATNGSSKVVVQAPSALSADATLTLPVPPVGTQLLQISSAGVVNSIADGTVGQFLTTNGTGTYSWGTSAASLQLAYNGGKTILATPGAVAISANSALNALEVTQSGAGQAMAISGVVTLVGNSTQTGDPSVTGNPSITGNPNITGNSTQNGTVTLTGNSTQTGISTVAGRLAITNTSTSAAIDITQSGAGQGIKIAQVGAENAIAITKSSTDNSSAIVCAVQSGSGAGLYVNNSGTGIGIRIDSSTGQCLEVNQTTSGSGIKVNIPGDGCDGVQIRKTDTTGPGLSSGACLQIYNSSGATPVSISQIHTGNVPVISIANSGSGRDVSATNWNVSKGGALTATAALLGGVVLAPTNKTIATGVITVAEADCFIRVNTESSAASDDLVTINGGVDGKVIVLCAVANSRTVNVKQTGNIDSGADRALNTQRDRIVLQWDAAEAVWCMISFADND